MFKELKEFFIVVFGFYFIGFCFYGAIFYFQLRPAEKAPDSNIELNREFFIGEGEGVSQIGQKLQDENLIKSSSSFKFYLLLRGWASKINPGRYFLSPALSGPKIAKILVEQSAQKEVSATIPEGWTLKTIEDYLIKKDVLTSPLLSDLKIKDFKDGFAFLKNAPEENNLEGFLFPDTYRFEKHSLAYKVGQKFLENFQEKALPSFSASNKESQLGFYDLVILASLVESEIPFSDDRLRVSGVIYNRLNNNWPLQIDSSIVYFNCFVAQKENCRQLFKDDLKNDSPYNTYTRQGLPVGPVGNPGFTAIFAALNPEKTDFWYYLSDPQTKKTIFSKTLEEHNLAKAKYLR